MVIIWQGRWRYARGDDGLMQVIGTEGEILVARFHAWLGARLLMATKNLWHRHHRYGRAGALSTRRWFGRFFRRLLGV